MRNWLRACCIAFAGAVLAGCAAQNAKVSEDTLMQQFQNGDASLNCTLNCQFAWVGQRPNALQMYNAERWHDLALLVMRIGYRNDLTYFYLGRAAEGLSHLSAAEAYYKTSEQLADSDLACAKGNNSCDGFAFPDIADTRLKDVEAALAPPEAPKHVVRRHYTKKPTASASQKTPESSSGVYIPPANAASSSGGAAAAPAASGGQSSSGGVYMPPAQH